MVRKLLLSFLFFTISFLSFAQTFTDSTPGGSKTWTVPNGVTTITLEIWGAGGAGGGSLVNKEGGAGGGAGAYVLRTITVTPGDIITYSVGAGAIGTSNAGTTGGATTLTTVSGTNLNANGGSGGSKAVHNASVSAGSGGSASGGTTNSNGSNGSNNSTSTGDGGNGGNSNGGIGGNGADGNNGGNGGNGANPGGGGGGGVLKGSSFGIGGNGGNGQVKISYCTAGTLSGNQYLCTYSPASTTFTSTVSGGTWSTSNSAIATVNSSTGEITTPANANGTATITYTVPATGGCPIQTATRILYATNTQPTTPNTPSGSSLVCQGTTATYTVNSIPNVTYIWAYTGTGATITPAADGLSATVSFSSTAGNFGRVEVATKNGCNPSGASGLNVFVSQLSNGGTITADKSTGCAGDTYITRLQLSGYVGLPIRWESSTDNFVSNIVSINNTNNGMNIENLTQTTSYRAVVQNSPCTAAAYSNIFKITIGSTAPYTVSTASSSPTVCINNAITPVTHATTVATGIENNGVSGANGLPPGVSATWSSDVITISGTPTSAVGSPFNYSIRLTGCSLTNAYATGTITVKTTTVTASSNPTICLGAGINITHTTTGATGIGTITGLPAGVVASWNTNTITISGTPTASGSFPYTIQLIGGCETVNATGTIKVNATPIAPTIVSKVVPTCSIPTGSVNLSGLPTTGIVRYLAQNSTTATYTITGTTMTISGLAPGKYKFAVDNPCGPAVYSDEIDISGNTWNGTSWSGGNAGPTSNDVLIFTGDYTATSDISGCSCTVTNNAKVTIKSGRTMTINNFVTVDSGSSLTFEDSSGLIQTNTDPNINSGNIEYIRTTLPIRQADYVYWSTPVKGQTLAAVSPLTESDKYFRFDGTGWVATPKTTIMTVGKGYIIRGPEGSSNTVRTAYTATFKGTPNNGTITTETFSAGKNYLIGNPYPSAIDADKFISDLNNKGLLQGTLYFWTHNTPVTLGGYYRYNADDYASYNLSGGTKTMKEAKTANNAPGNINSAPQGYIAAGQSFMAGLSFGGQIQFTNSMRVGADKNAQFFKPGKTSKTTAIEKNRVWLNLTNEEGAFKQMLVGYIEGASNDYDRGYDGLSFDGNKYIDFYSIGGVRKFVIQGRALPFTDTDTVPLGYKTTIAGDFTISIDQADGIFTTQSIYLEDKTTGKIQDLRAANYTFTTAIGTFADRFVLRYTNKTLGTGDFENVENGLLVAVKDKTIKVTSAKETIKEVTIFDINGKLLYSKKKVGSTELQISNLQAANQVLLVKITLENDFLTTKKIMFQ
jgi:hypothetical protein